MVDSEDMSPLDSEGVFTAEEQTGDERASEDKEEMHLDPHRVLEKMLRIARRMSQKDRQEQKLLLSLAIQAIETVESEAESQLESERDQEARIGDSAEEVKKGETLPPLPAMQRRRVPRRKHDWTPELLDSITQLRAQKVGWAEIAKSKVPGWKTGSVQCGYFYWLRKLEDAAGKGKRGDEKPDRAEELREDTVYLRSDEERRFAQNATDEETPKAPSILSAFEMKRKANMEVNQALLNQIVPSVGTSLQVPAPKRKRTSLASTQPSAIRRSG